MGMEVFGYAITFLSVVLTIIAWHNGREMKAAVAGIREDVRAVHESVQVAREQMARQHEDVMTLLRAIHESLQASREQAARQHEDTMALLRAMDERAERMHAETQRVLLRIAELIAAEGERTRAALSGGGNHSRG